MNFINILIDINGKENLFFVVIGNRNDLYEIVSKKTGEENARAINALFSN